MKNKMFKRFLFRGAIKKLENLRADVCDSYDHGHAVYLGVKNQQKRLVAQNHINRAILKLKSIR